MRQITGSFTKTFKCYTRIRAIAVFTVLMPMFLLLITGVSLSASVSPADIPLAKGVLTISMVAFSLMLAGILNLAGSITRDRETGLLTKLKSMPIRPWRDFLGRIMAAGLLTLMAAILIIAVGLAYGARFNGTAMNYLEAIGYLLLAMMAAAGIGLVIGSYTKLVLATFFTGLAITLFTAFVGGIFITYESLPSALQAFARFYPISSAASSAVYLLLGKGAAGYDPLTAGQVISTILIGIGFLAVGVFTYSREAWKRD
jgi:ABC-type multidrug transport system permease subunit